MKIDPRNMPALADEYVLGLLEGYAKQALERELERNSALRAAVGESRDRFLPLDQVVAPAEVDRQLWERIEAALPATGAVAADRIVNPANDNAYNGWKATALSAIVAAIMLAIGLGFSLLRVAEPVVIAVLLNDRGGVHAVIEDFGDRNARVRLLEHYDVPAGKTIQAWTLPSRAMGPVSLGLLEGETSSTLQMPVLPRPQAEQLYELTIEDQGGSPTGKPTGAIIAKGFAKLPI